MTQDWEGRHKHLSDSERKLLRILSDALDHKPRYFGLKPSEWIIVGTIFMGVCAFYVRTNDTIEHLIKLTDYCITFANNSDTYHSVVTKMPFRQGQPTGITYQLTEQSRQGQGIKNEM